MHLFEDAAMVEVVDEDDRPVPAGVWGASVLVTPFHNRLQPLIRYRLSDELRLSDERCPCGRPFRVLDGLKGRAEEYLTLPALEGGGTIDVTMFVFHIALLDLPASGQQVIQSGNELSIRLERHRGPMDEAAFIRQIESALHDAGARASRITIDHVDEIPRGPGGKVPRLVKRSEGAPESGSHGGPGSSPGAPTDTVAWIPG